MDLNVTIFFIFDIGFVQENISAGTLEMAMCCPNCSTYCSSLVPKWFPLRTNDPSDHRVVVNYSMPGPKVVTLVITKLSLSDPREGEGEGEKGGEGERGEGDGE